MGNISFNPIYLLSIELFGVTIVVLTYFWRRMSIGKGGLYMLAGLFLAVAILPEAYLSQQFSILGWKMEVNSGACILYPANLFIILLIYISQRRSSNEVGVFIINFTGISITTCALIVIYSLYSSTGNVPGTGLARLFSAKAALSLFIGFLLLLLEIIILIITYESLHKKPFFARSFLSLYGVYVLDAITYPLVRYYTGQQPSVEMLRIEQTGHTFATLVTAFVYSIGLYLERFIDADRAWLLGDTAADPANIKVSFTRITDMLPSNIIDIIAEFPSPILVHKDRSEAVMSINQAISKAMISTLSFEVIVLRIPLYNVISQDTQSYLRSCISLLYSQEHNKVFVLNYSKGELALISEDHCIADASLSNEIIRWLSMDLADPLRMAGDLSSGLQIGHAHYNPAAEQKIDARGLLREARRSLQSYLMPREFSHSASHVPSDPQLGRTEDVGSITSSMRPSLARQHPTQDILDEPRPKEALLEEFDGKVERVEGDTAHITLTLASGECLSGLYGAADLAALGIREMDRFKLQTRQVADCVRIDIIKNPTTDLSMERQREIEEELAAVLNELEIGDDY